MGVSQQGKPSYLPRRLTVETTERIVLEKIPGPLEASFRARGQRRGFSPAAAARHRSRTTVSLDLQSPFLPCVSDFFEIGRLPLDFFEKSGSDIPFSSFFFVIFFEIGQCFPRFHGVAIPNIAVLCANSPPI